jgi:outer membrane protein assembly factor BamB
MELLIRRSSSWPGWSRGSSARPSRALVRACAPGLALMLGLFLTLGSSPVVPIATAASATGLNDGPPALAPSGSAAGDGSLTAPTPEGLKILWHDRLGRGVAGDLLLVPGRLVVATTDNRLHCRDRESGRRVWTRSFKDPIEAGPALSWSGADSAARIYLVLMGKKRWLRAIDAVRGRDLWATALKIQVRQMEGDGERLWILEMGGRLSCRSACDGKELWAADAPGWSPGGFRLERDRVYLLCRKDSLIAFQAETGRRLWTSAPGGVYAARPGRVGGDLVVISTAGRASWIDPSSGAIRARASRAAPQLACAAGVRESVVTVSSGGAVEAGGAPEARPVWRREIGRAVNAPAVIAGSLILIATTDGLLLALHPERGDPAWSLQTRGGFSIPPLWAGDDLILATDRGEVYVYREHH